MYVNRQRLFRLLLFCAIALPAIGQELQAQSVLRIGVIDQPDGPMLAGARLAADEINAAGGLVGADGSLFQLLVVDSSPERLDIAIANMRQASAIAVIGPVANRDLADGLPGLQKLNVAVLTPATGDAALFLATSGRIFRSRSPDSHIAAAIADYLVNSLGIDSLQTIQLDFASTVRLLALANALAPFGLFPANLHYDEASQPLESIAASLSLSAPDAVAIFGPPSLAAQSYNAIRGAGYRGEIVYHRAHAADFQELVPVEALPGIISAATWSPALDDPASSAFTLAYARAFGKLPDALSAAGYDSLRMIAQAAARAGPLEAELAAMAAYQGVQGEINLSNLLLGDGIGNVVITRLNKFGQPAAAARYGEQSQYVAPAAIGAPERATPSPTGTPVPSATPTGYHLVIKNEYQNVRSGPGLEYEVIGKALKGAHLRVLGATADYSWLVIDYRGQWGWLAAYLVETFGDRHLVPVIQPPATSTPPPTATTAPPREPDLVVVSAQPERLTLDQANIVYVTVRNQGLSQAGNFAMASTFQPGNHYAGVNQAGLAPQQQTTLQLAPNLKGRSGPQSVIIVVDLNQEVHESPAGEANNQVFVYSYIADRPVLSSGRWTIAPGSFDLDGDALADFTWTGGEMTALDNAGLVLMNHFSSLGEAHYDALDISQATTKTLNAQQLRNAIIGIVSADGHRGYVKVHEVALNGSLTVEYRIYR